MDREQQTKKNGRVETALLYWCVALLLVLVGALILTQVVLINAQIPSDSMADTVCTGDRIIGLRLSYQNSEPARFDIIIFKYPDDESQLYIKRIIGLPGEEVSIEQGAVYVNGAELPCAFASGSAAGSFGPYRVPAGSYFVLGDNRDKSWDSRFWQCSYVSREQIIGRAAWRIWPELEALA